MKAKNWTNIDTEIGSHECSSGPISVSIFVQFFFKFLCILCHYHLPSIHFMYYLYVFGKNCTPLYLFKQVCVFGGGGSGGRVVRAQRRRARCPEFKSRRYLDIFSSSCQVAEETHMLLLNPVFNCECIGGLRGQHEPPQASLKKYCLHH